MSKRQDKIAEVFQILGQNDLEELKSTAYLLTESECEDILEGLRTICIAKYATVKAGFISNAFEHHEKYQKAWEKAVKMFIDLDV